MVLNCLDMQTSIFKNLTFKYASASENFVILKNVQQISLWARLCRRSPHEAAQPRTELVTGVRVLVAQLLPSSHQLHAGESTQQTTTLLNPLDGNT